MRCPAASDQRPKAGVGGRDALKTGDMWNSNSVIAWLVARSEIDTESIRPPRCGPYAGMAGRARGRAKIGGGEAAQGRRAH